MKHRHDSSNRFTHPNEAAKVLEELGGELHAPGRSEPVRNGHRTGEQPRKSAQDPASSSASNDANAITLDSFPEEGITPDWLEPFIQGDLDIEEAADRIADAIRQDPRLTRRIWWQRVINRLVAVAPERLIAMAESLADLRANLQRHESKN